MIPTTGGMRVKVTTITTNKDATTIAMSTIRVSKTYGMGVETSTKAWNLEMMKVVMVQTMAPTMTKETMRANPEAKDTTSTMKI